MVVVNSTMIASFVIGEFVRHKNYNYTIYYTFTISRTTVAPKCYATVTYYFVWMYPAHIELGTRFSVRYNHERQFVFAAIIANRKMTKIDCNWMHLFQINDLWSYRAHISHSSAFSVSKQNVWNTRRAHTHTALIIESMSVYVIAEMAALNLDEYAWYIYRRISSCTVIAIYGHERQKRERGEANATIEKRANERAMENKE